MEKDPKVVHFQLSRSRKITSIPATLSHIGSEHSLQRHSGMVDQREAWTQTDPLFDYESVTKSILEKLDALYAIMVEVKQNTSDEE